MLTSCYFAKNAFQNSTINVMEASAMSDFVIHCHCICHRPVRALSYHLIFVAVLVVTSASCDPKANKQRDAEGYNAQQANNPELKVPATGLEVTYSSEILSELVHPLVDAIRPWDDRRQTSIAINRLAMSLAHAGHSDLAREVALKAPFAAWQTDALVRMSWIAQGDGEKERAASLLQEAEQRSFLTQPWEKPKAAIILGQAFVRKGQPEKAKEFKAWGMSRDNKVTSLFLQAETALSDGTIQAPSLLLGPLDGTFEIEPWEYARLCAAWARIAKHRGKTNEAANFARSAIQIAALIPSRERDRTVVHAFRVYNTVDSAAAVDCIKSSIKLIEALPEKNEKAVLQLADCAAALSIAGHIDEALALAPQVLLHAFHLPIDEQPSVYGHVFDIFWSSGFPQKFDQEIRDLIARLSSPGRKQVFADLAKIELIRAALASKLAIPDAVLVANPM